VGICLIGESILIGAGKSVKDITSSLKTKGYLSDLTKSVNKKKATHEWVIVSQKRNELMSRLFEPTYKIAQVVRVLIIIFLFTLTCNSSMTTMSSQHHQP